VYPGDLLCILVTPPAACQEGASPCGGIHRGSVCLGIARASRPTRAQAAASTRPALSMSRPAASAVPGRLTCRSNARLKSGAQDTKSLSGTNVNRTSTLDFARLTRVAASLRSSAARPARPALKYGANRRKSASADWIWRRLAMRFKFDRRGAACSFPDCSYRGFREQQAAPLRPCMVAAPSNATSRLVVVDALIRTLPTAPGDTRSWSLRHHPGDGALLVGGYSGAGVRHD
jgi:hypothetical protein